MSLTRKELNELVAELEAERASYDAHWRDINEHVRPRSAKFLVAATNRGDKRNGKIINNTATMASRTLESGMMSGVTSPARPWFRLSTGNPDLDKVESIKHWLHTVGDRMREVFSRSNLYTMLPLVYGDLGDYGISALAALEDDETIVRFDHFPIGSYAIATDENGRVDTIARKWQMTVRQLVQRFGKDRVSAHVKNQYDANRMGIWIDVAHVVHRNPDFIEGSPQAKHKKWCSAYFECGSQSRGDDIGEQMLRTGGFDSFPVMAPRWSVTGEDPYGNSPGMEALGDIKGLQLKEKRKAQMIEKGANPPMSAPSSLKNHRTSLLPGDVTFVDVTQGGQGFAPVYAPNPVWLQALEGDIAKDEYRIRRAYYEDLFLMLANMDGVQPRNQMEISERKEEKLLQLGPVMDRLNDELFDPLIDRTFDIMVRLSEVDWAAGGEGLIPMPPEELRAMQGEKLKVEYTSVMAQAMKAVGLGSLDRFAAFIGNIAAADPSVMDRWNRDEHVKAYHENLGLAPNILNGDEQVAAVRAERAKKQNAMEAMQVAKEGAQAAQALGGAQVNGDTALANLVGNLNPNAMPLPI